MIDFFIALFGGTYLLSKCAMDGMRSRAVDISNERNKKEISACINLEREKELIKQIDNALFTPDQIRVLNNPKNGLGLIRHCYATERESIEIERKLFSDPLFDVIKPELEELFKDGARYGSYILPIVCTLMLAKEGLVDARFSSSAAEMKVYSGSDVPLDIQIKAAKMVENIVREHHPDLRLYWDRKYGDKYGGELRWETKEDRSWAVKREYLQKL